MRRNSDKTGFTLIELLTVVAIISMLVGLISVGLRKTAIVSKNLRQKSVFHGMEVGIAMFSNDFDGYPDSEMLNNGSGAVCGAQRLAEALVGRDENGIEPLTGWYPPDDTAYLSTAQGNQITQPDYSFYDYAQKASQYRRKPVYIDMRHTDLRTIHDLWQGDNGTSQVYDSGAAPSVRYEAPVLLDVFTRNRINLTGGGTLNAGLPILYFKADDTKRFRVNAARQFVAQPDVTEYRQWVFNYEDNAEIVELPLLRDPPKENMDDYQDRFDLSKTKPQIFYETITQHSDPDRVFYKPFNESTYLLISAGYDGVYGTEDDITNFNY